MNSSSYNITRKRKLKSLTLGQVSRGQAYTPSSILTLAGNTGSFDIGALSYVSRSTQKRSYVRIVKAGSLKSNRKKRIALWVDTLAVVSVGGKRESSIGADVKSIIAFLDYIELGKDIDGLKNSTSVERSLSCYYDYLINKIRESKLESNTAGRYLNSVVYFLACCFPEHANKINSDYKNKIKTHTVGKETSVPDQSVIESNIKFLSRRFSSLSSHCIKFEKYPSLVDLGDGLEWIFPISQWKKKTSLSSGLSHFTAYDFENGCIRDYIDIRGIYTVESSAKRAVAAAKEVIEKANRDRRHWTRIRLAVRAHNAFVMLFLAVTGMNLEGVRSLLWDSNYTTVKDGINFRIIKYRANGRECEFPVEATFMPVFREYLKLREYMLGGRHCEWLFMTLPGSDEESPTQLSDEITNKLRLLHESSEESNSAIVGAREWRVTKYDKLVRSTDLVTAAHIMQSELRTAAKHYIAGSETAALDEMTEGLEAIDQLIVKRSKKFIPIPTGNCEDKGNPIPIIGSDGTADCKTWEGCLGCKHYGVHADEIDVRKLWSARTVVLSTRHLADSESNFILVFGFFLGRIDELILQIERVSKEHKKMVRDTKRSVNSGYLDNYWMGKYEMFISLGLIND